MDIWVEERLTIGSGVISPVLVNNSTMYHLVQIYYPSFGETKI